MGQRAARQRANEIARRVLGERGTRAARNLYRTVRPVAPPPDRPVAYPHDVRDAQALREFLVDTDVFAFDPPMGERYVNEALERFRITMSLVPDLPAGARVLELGANPYFLTRLLSRRGYDVRCANFHGDGRPAVGRETVRSGDETLAFEFDHFNVERDRFPYADSSFDVVLCCEIIEHLPNDPTHLLCEIHRVLVDSGTLILTTPNPVRWRMLLEMIEGRNVYEHLSGFGTYGRHNREYTVRELNDLLIAVGFVDVDVFDAHLEPPPEWIGTLPPGIATAHRGDNLFATARARGVPVRAYPAWLYDRPKAD